MKVQIGSEGELASEARELWDQVKHQVGKKAIIFGLEGPLGAGKTAFTKELAKTIGVLENIVSPTYLLNVQYLIPETETWLEHIDAWRMEQDSELEQLKFRDMVERKSIIVVEWADQVKNVIEKYAKDSVLVWVKIEYGKEANERTITYENSGN